MIKYLLANQVIAIHDLLIKNFGGLSGIRDKNLLYSALDAPKASFRGKEMYPSIYEKAGIYLYHLVCNHPFLDGNKRTAYVVTLAFVRANHASVKFDIRELEDVVLGVANGKISKEKLVHFIVTGSSI